MSTRRSIKKPGGVAVALLAGLTLVVASVVVAPASRADDPPASADPCGGQISDFVDFSKPPNEIEGQNKVRVGIQPTTDPKKGLSIEVIGTAYYPDDVVIILGIRHAKVKKYFEQKKVYVKDRSFTYTFGPYAKMVPGGGLVVEAEFILPQQTKPVQKALVDGHFLRCSPPCKHDMGNRFAVTYSLGGAAAEQAAVKAEKDAIGEARKGLMDAYKVCDTVIAQIEAKAASGGAPAALARLEKDLDAVLVTFNNFKTTRQFLLFNERANQLKTLRTAMSTLLRARATLAGESVVGMPMPKATAEKPGAQKEFDKGSEELKSFIDEADSLDKAYEASKQTQAPAQDKKDEKAPDAKPGDPAKPADAKPDPGASTPPK